MGDGGCLSSLGVDEGAAITPLGRVVCFGQCLATRHVFKRRVLACRLFY